jgi:YjbE family integral membrane protein
MVFLQVILLDIVLSGDNAVIIGTLAASLDPKQRNKAIGFGMLLAVIARVMLSLGVVYLLMIPGIMIIGGLLLFYVAWKMWSDLRDDGSIDGSNINKEPKSFGSALVSIAIADISMSLDNVLAVAGTVAGHWPALVFGLFLSVAIMAVAAKLVSNIIDKHKWVSYIGLLLILFVAGRMVYHGVPELLYWLN